MVGNVIIIIFYLSHFLPLFSPKRLLEWLEIRCWWQDIPCPLTCRHGTKGKRIGREKEKSKLFETKSLCRDQTS